MTIYDVMKKYIKVGSIYVLESWGSIIVILNITGESVTFCIVGGEDRNRYNQTISWFIDGIHKGKLFFKQKMPVFL